MSVTTSRSLLSEGNAAALEALRNALGSDAVSTRELDRMALAVDASHYLHTPDAVMRAKTPTDVGVAMRIAAELGWPLTFRGGGTSLSGQALSEGLTVDVRRHFRNMEVLDNGKRVRVQPGLTIGQVNATLARYGSKLGPDPASSIACTIGGLIANNSSGMSCGITANTYRTIDSMTIVLPSGTVVNTADPNADDVLRAAEPNLVEVLERLRDTLRGDKYRADIERRYAIKNTMGYGINSFLDFDTPAKILEHLMIGSEGTLGFVSEAVFNTVPVPKHTATGLLMFDSLDAATEALPALVYSGADVVELIDAASIRAMGEDAASVLPRGFQVDQHASLLVEYQAMDTETIGERIAAGEATFEKLSGLSTAPEMTNEAQRRGQMWVMRNGLYTKIMRNRPKGTMALLEDIAVPMEQLGGVCTELQDLFTKHNYDGAVIFGHAKNGNIHFLVTEDFAGPASLNRYDAFTEDMVDLVLREQGTLKAEHGTGRIMSPFVRRQYGDDLYQAMVDIKDACDPKRILNPGTIITDDPQLHLKHIKPTEEVRELIDDCVECGYCEPVCPSQHLTTTPRQRIVIQRAIAACEATGAYELAERLKEQEVYDVVQTCAVDGMCLTACPVKINTGDLIREKRRETQKKALDKGWKVAAEHWGAVLGAASVGMNITHALPTAPLRGALGLVRKATSEDLVPTLTPELPGGGKLRKPTPATHPDAIFLPACVGTMFGSGHACGMGVEKSLRELASYAGRVLSTPEGVQQLCCGTPWKSKGLAQGYEVMKEKLTAWIVEHTDGGRIPLVCDNVSCTEGIIVALKNSGIENIDVMDATEWVARYVAPMLPPLDKARRAAVHPTCSSTHLGVNDALMMLAGLVADEAIIPDGWRCCAFAGDRGLLHEELTATSTRDEARSVKRMNPDLFLSCNRTCELGLTRATGHTYVHVLEELAARLPNTQ
ncbi:FAD-binding and (Fe-S)-binding domain-containing protein [Corynebacterium sp.]|uniref:FAD-binding and (Fe-S)-binding domain-containing protein n=1 Tax=Corynebacterium sp. TaxID=1720 RepID=UPI0026DCFB80|nr:FAD-binding and (Fe-S)-binding domain-containing protein [Corynebacterium sp.]MDO5076343.1 FAD-binding and (Fe-S)-binding domain-containing protein [Corynebacterium sp.]